MSAEPQLFRINPENRDSERVTEVEFSHLGFQERRDIQEWIAANPGILGEGLLIIGKEFSGFDRTNERLDLLAVDEDGKLVVIELKRDHTGSDAHWQAIKYASYLHRARREDIIGVFADHADISETKAVDQLLQHLGADDLNGLNNDQRIILASHRFAPEVTSAALWLNEKNPGEDLITCVQLIPYHDLQTGSLYIQTNTIIPIPGEEELIITIGKTPVESSSGGTGKPQRNDGVTKFLRKTADIALSNLAEHVRPNRRSRWASGGPDDGVVEGVFRRFYHVWYGNTSPWGNWDVSYRMNLYPDTESEGFIDADDGNQSQYSVNLFPNTESAAWELGPWNVILELAYLSDELRNKITESHLDDKLIVKNRRIIAAHSSNALNDEFANTLAKTLKYFIETFTPIVNKFEDERANQEAAP